MKRRAVVAVVLAASAWLGTPAFAQQTKVFTPGPFDSVTVSGSARIELTQGDSDQVTVIGDHDAQRSVHLGVTGNELHIETQGGWKFWNRDQVDMKVQMRSIKSLNISGASDIVATKAIMANSLDINISGKGEVRFGNLAAKQLDFEISGAGSGTMVGKVDKLIVNVSGAGKIVADNLRAAQADINISGAGSTDLWVTDELSITVSGVGSVSYWGQPKVSRKVSALGRMNALGTKP
ncbi:MAG: head GIN domain-containing protein [Ramlibacter sp.]